VHLGSLAAQPQSETDRPPGCWWQPGQEGGSQGSLYFNEWPSSSGGGQACSDAFQCMCCGATTTTTTWAGTCVPQLVGLGAPYAAGSCPRPYTSAEDCAAAVAAHPELGTRFAPDPASAVKGQEAPDRPFGCWYEAERAHVAAGVYFNAEQTHRPCTEDRPCLCCGEEGRTIPDHGFCNPGLVESGPSSGLTVQRERAVQSASECEAVASSLLGVALQAVVQSEQNRPAGCWLQEAPSRSLFFNTPPNSDQGEATAGAAPCTTERKCVSCLHTTTMTTVTSTTTAQTRTATSTRTSTVGSTIESTSTTSEPAATLMAASTTGTRTGTSNVSSSSSSDDDSATTATTSLPARLAARSRVEAVSIASAGPIVALSVLGAIAVLASCAFLGGARHACGASPKKVPEHRAVVPVGIKPGKKEAPLTPTSTRSPRSPRSFALCGLGSSSSSRQVSPRSGSGGTTLRLTRQELIRSVFHHLAGGGGGKAAVACSELQRLGHFMGFDGSDEEWRREYVSICQLLKCKIEVGLDFAAFNHLVNDNSQAGCFCSDENLALLRDALTKSSGGTTPRSGRALSPTSSVADFSL